MTQRLLQTAGLFALTFAAASCGEVAFKSGASSGQYAADQNACRAAGDNLPACMQGKGWTVVQNQTAATPAPAQQAAAPSAVAAPAVRGTPAPVLAVKAAGGTAPSKVQVWAKFGGGDATADLDACVAALGEDFRPDWKTHMVKPALLACMKQRGWSGF